MKYLNQILASILALPYVVFGANYFLNFIPMPPPTTDPAGIYSGLLMSSGFMIVVKIMEIVFGAMIAANYKRALALILISPISVNILMFEVFIAKQPAIGILLVLLNAILIFRYKEKYMSIVS
ncbi:MAG: hypothetical protein EAZ97_08870 [Bacteroidetes bacterium]|nr:MAG: hypothetical protein EAZ97_08870 [Bacteroidota bacterium]